MPMPPDPARVKAIFQAATEIIDPADRRSFLDRECGPDAPLRARLDALLDAFDHPAVALDRPLAAPADADETLAHTPALAGAECVETSADPASIVAAASDTSDETVVSDPSDDAGVPTATLRPADPVLPADTLIAGRYKIRQEIGEGGMGSVYLADQTQPVKRRVALKLIKPGMDSRTVLARFESERQALALMDHPHIAKVLDAGTTDTGRPFFVMELVKGIPLTDYCDQHRLDLPARLALFRQICSAVQHAHQKGIIHRDLKPTNILVESHDGKPVPKVIDFGLAKATSGMTLTDNSLFTAFGSVTGTPLYMAPEQASFNALDVDTRADIYALGVILYELLTGSTPIRRETIKRAALDEMLRVIREVEPPTPSSRISTSEGLPSLAANRHVEPSRLSRLVKGDLDWIVMKALAKERDRRYESAIGLSNDVERYLNHEPVSAGPPTARYRFGKFVRRNRGRVAAAGLVLLALVGGVAGTTVGLVEARKQARIARAESAAKEAARVAEAAQRRVAVEQRGQAERRLAQVAKMNEILGAIFADLNPKKVEKEGKPLTAILGERLVKAAETIQGEATGDPLAVARMQLVVGQSLLGLGFAEKAINLFTKAHATCTTRLGPDHPNTLRTMSNLADSYRNAGRLDEALTLFEQALTLSKAKLGPDHPDTIRSMNNLAGSYGEAGRLDEALTLFEQALTLSKAKLGPDHPETVNSMGNLAISYQNAGRLDEALTLFEQALTLRKAKLGPDHPDTIMSMGNLANSYHDAGRRDEAVRLYEEVVSLRKAKLGPEHPDTIRTMGNLANSYRDAGRRDEALTLYEQALTLSKAKLGPDHPDTLGIMVNLANSYRDAGRRDEALKMNEQALTLSKAKLGPDHPNTLTSMGNLAISYHNAGRRDEALTLFEQVLMLRKAKLGPDHPETLKSMGNLAGSYRDAGRLDEALRMYEQVLTTQKAMLGPNHPSTLKSMHNLAVCYGDAGRFDKSVGLYEEVVTLRKAKLGPDHPDTLMSLASMAQAIQDGGQFDRAESLWDELVARRRKARGEDAPETLAARLDRADLDLARTRHDDAIAAYRPILDACRAKLGLDHAHTLRAERSLLAALEAKGDMAGTAPLRRFAVERARRPGVAKPELAGALASLGRALLAPDSWVEAETVLRECLALCEAAEPDAWTTFNTRSLLGAALLGQGKTAEAGPLLRSGYEGMAKRADKIPPLGKPRLAEALDRLIALGEATGKADEVKAWKEERAKLDPAKGVPEAEKK